MRSRAILTALVVTFLAACQAGEEGDESQEGAAAGLPEAVESPVATATEYTTRLHFLPYEAGTSRGVALDFANLATSAGLQHRYTGWELTRSGWRTVLDADYQDAQTRAAWRLFPSPTFRFTVSADGDPELLVFDVGRLKYSLELAGTLDRWEDRTGTLHEIREATWIRGTEERGGIAVRHRFATGEPERPARFGPYDRALLRSEDGAIIVLFHTTRAEVYGSPYAWMYADGLTRRWTELETRPVEVANSTQLRRNVPIRIWFRIPEPDIRCELTAAERQFNELSVEDGPKPYNALYRVRGWVEFAGERRQVEGLLDRGEP